MAQAEEGKTQAAALKAAEEFAAFWADRGEEKQETQKFWLALLRDVLGVVAPEKVLDFEKRVKVGSTKYIDGYIAETRTIIEQKGSKIDLDAAEAQSDGRELTPFEQAKRYDDNLPLSEKARWIVVSNFTEIRVHDMEKTEPEKHYETVMLADLPKERYRLAFLVDQKNEDIRREEDLSLKAGRLVGRLFDALYAEYIPPENEGEARTEGNPRGLSPSQLRSLNVLCVRTVFCLYAEDAGLFATRTAFEDYIKGFSLQNARTALMKLFQALDTPIGERDQYEQALEPFPYVNGGLFKDENIEIPGFTQEIVDVIVDECAPFNWSEISPTIFGAVFESTLNPDTRRKGGMHYTSIANIHKVIDPLFLDGLTEEFDGICATKAAKQRNERLAAFQKKLGSLTFLDPACGSGNFLTETYLSLRTLENRAIRLRFGGQVLMGDFENPIRVHIGQFYGIELNDFAVTVAKTALWIAESQMACETEAVISQSIPFLPLTNHANIIEGNSLRMDWGTLSDEGQVGYLFAEKLNIYDEADFEKEGLEIRAPEADATSLYGKRFKELNVIQRTSEHKKPASPKRKPVTYDYIMGNPPFSGARIMRKESEQKKDIADTFADVKGAGNLDYVCCWYKKAAEYMRGKPTKTALVSTNSIIQGEHVAILWKLIFGMGIQIDFAYRTFKWYSESSDMAHVHCVIIGFSDAQSAQKQKFLIDADGKRTAAKNINGYLLDMPNVFVERRQHPLCDVPEIWMGNQPIDGGFYLFGEAEMRAFIKKEPKSEPYFHVWMGSDEFIKGNKRWCLWLGDLPPAELLKMPECMKRVQAVRDYRLKSTSAPTIKLAEKPTHFHVENFPKGTYIVVPEVSSGKRKYVPMGFLTPDIFCSNLVKIIPNATLYHFGVLTSSVHNIWLRTVGGRMKSDYRYSKDIVYNNFPWCTPSDEQKAEIEAAAQGILDVRAKYADCTMAQLYGEQGYLFPELVKAHEANDKAVMSAYGFAAKMSEGEVVGELFKMYEKLTRKA